MGNCSFKGFDPSLDPIRVITCSGQALEFNGPKLVSEVIKDFPKHGIFKKDQLSSPLDHREQLIGGQFYHLFPLFPEEIEKRDQTFEEKALSELGAIEAEPVRMSTSTVALQLVTKNLTDGSGFEVLPPPRKGVWKVKLMINTKQLEEILSEEVNTEALIEQMRVAAASSRKAVPRRNKLKWGVKLKPIFCNVLNKMVVDDNSSPKSVTPILQ
ncbi:Protein of unknown function DUF4228 [Cynara cardunculus var. scolymus]|uniref:Uncharacterized protein n=1 Tax=Cynara cardunculus var. scolymus TaxID=59895 RepID=A0A103XR40_CYNCS|nr:Protein of unknown function DUF4228 [Cynara cardunculus var. scolymus]